MYLLLKNNNTMSQKITVVKGTSINQDKKEK